jgi:hypothetical protein
MGSAKFLTTVFEVTGQYHYCKGNATISQNRHRAFGVLLKYKWLTASS